MDISEINFNKIAFILEKQLLDVCDGDIKSFEKINDIVGEMTFREDFSFCDIDRLIQANKGYKKILNRDALNENFVEYVLPSIKQYENCKEPENKQIYLQALLMELHKSYWENINEKDLIQGGNYAVQMLDYTLPMKEMNVKVRFNEKLEEIREYFVKRLKDRKIEQPPIDESR